MESVGFKEWAVVCEALGDGRQSIILRKGGIAEGREGFSFRHREFFLFPTWFHEQPQKVRPELATGRVRPTGGPDGQFITEMPKEHPGLIEIRYAVTVDALRTITLLEVAEALAPFHILQPEVIRERFEYDEAPGLQVAFVRTYRLQPSWSFPNEKKYGGCRSWVPLPDLPNDLAFDAVLSEAEHKRRKEQFLSICGAFDEAP
jgi:hypothetical protein